VIDHLTLTVKDLASARAFYAQALAPLGYRVVMEFGSTCAFGAEGKPSLWLAEGEAPTSPLHLALVAGGRSEVDLFHREALKAGGRDNGAPGLRTQYHPSYYAAFVFDPDGHNLEAVCHQEPARAAKGKPRAATGKARAAKGARAAAPRRAPARAKGGKRKAGRPSRR